METVQVTNVNEVDKKAQQQSRALVAQAWMKFYKVVDEKGVASLNEIASQFGLDPNIAANKYNERMQKQAIKAGTVTPADMAIPSPATAKPAFQLLQYKPKEEKPEMEQVPVDHPVAEQIFAEPVKVSPTKKPLRLYDITENRTELLKGGEFCGQIESLPISKDWIRTKYGGGVYIVRELQPDNTETLVQDKNGMPIGSIEIAMTLEDQKRRMFEKNQNEQIIKNNIPKEQTPMEKIMYDAMGNVIQKSLQPQPTADPMAQLSQIITIMNQLRPPQTGLSESDKRLNERLDQMQAQLMSAKEATLQKEIEFLRERINDKKLSSSPSEAIKDVVSKTIMEMGLKGKDDEEEGWLTTAFKTAAKSETTVNRALDIFQGVGFAILQALTKSPITNGAQTVPESPKAITGTVPPPQAEVKQPVTETPKTQQEQIEHYQRIDKEQTEKDVLKFIKVVMNAPDPSDVQIAWILQGESIPFIFPVEINEINDAIDKVWLARANGNKEQVEIECTHVREAFGKFKDPMKNVFASEQGKSFIEGLIKNYVMEE